MRKADEFSYNADTGRWWLQHSLDAPHRRAYRRIADFIRDSYVRDPPVIVDYACGSGNLLALLSLRFARSKLIGLDGSAFLLSHARRRFALLPTKCADRISLVETPLPNIGLLRGKADLVSYCFPNMVPWFSGPSFSPPILCPGDRQIARNLAVASVALEESSREQDAVAHQQGLEQGRSVSLNLRRLLRGGGICVRVEYATMRRHDLTPHELTQVSFEEGSLDSPVQEDMPRRWFRFLASAFFRSRVLEDVYEQTGDERDRNGGYLITVLRAI